MIDLQKLKIIKPPRLKCFKNKISLVSKNRKVAKVEWNKKQEALKKGEIPEEYREYLGPKQKKFTSKSTFLNDERLNEQKPAYVQLKTSDYQMMNREIEEKEHRITKILNHNENSKVSNQPRKERPITSIQPNRGQKKLIVDHSIENNEDRHCSIKTYNNYVNDQPKHEDFYENEFNNGEVHSPETDDIIGMMNDRNSRPTNNVSKFGVNSMQKKSTYPSYADQKQNTQAKIENQEFDYLDYQCNIDNLKKISDEQSKYDNLGGDLDSYFSGLNSLLGKRQGTNPVSNYQSSSNIEDFHQDNKPRNINEVVDIYKELGLPKLPDELPKLESVNYRNVIPDYKSSYDNENLENENPNINFAANYYGCSKEDAFNPDIDSILNPKLSQNSYNKNMISEIPSWRDAKLVLNNQQNPHVSYDMYEEAPRSLSVTTSYGVSKYSGNTVLQQNKFDVNYKNNDLIDHDFHEEERMQAPVPYSVNQTQSKVSYMYAQPESYRAPEPNKSVIPPKPMCFADVLKNQTKPQVASEGRSIFIKPSVPINNAPSQPYKVYSKPENEISGAIIDYNDDELKRLAELIQSTIGHKYLIYEGFMYSKCIKDYEFWFRINLI